MEMKMDWNKILDALRLSGEINMFGAPQWLVTNYGLERHEANKIFKEWTKTYG
jgi:hypothetical protein